MESVLKSRSNWQRRYTMVLLCFFSIFICYIDRINISVAIIPMTERFDWNETQKGLVLSAFFAGYLITQALGGWLSNRFGPKRVLFFAVAWWSAFTIFTPLAAIYLPFIGLLIVRFLMGVGEGAAFPTVYGAMARWVPVAERSRSATLVFSASSLGSLVALGFSPFITVSWGWPGTFYLFGGLGFVWLLFWVLLASDSPQKDSRISHEEKIFLKEELPENTAKESVPWKKLLSKRSIQVIFLAHFCNNWGLYVLLSWMPSYFSTALGIDLKSMAIFLVLPWVTQFIVGNFSGWVADDLHKRGLSLTSVRKIMQTIGFVGPAVSLVLLSFTSDANQAVLLLCCALGFSSFGFAGFATNFLDVAPKHADVLFGMSNTVATLPGIFAVAFAGWIIDVTGSYASVFILISTVYFIGWIAYLRFATGDDLVG